MNYKVLSIPPFDKQLKHLSGKYPSIKRDYADLLEKLEKNPEEGIPLGNNCYKIRMAITSKGRGKSGGARVITHFVVAGATVYLLSIYDKSEKVGISDKELNELLKYVLT